MSLLQWVNLTGAIGAFGILWWYLSVMLGVGGFAIGGIVFLFAGFCLAFAIVE